MPLRNMVELCFEGINKDDFDLEVVLVNELEETKFVGELIERDKVNWVVVRTDHFSPYELVDKFPDEDNSPGRLTFWLFLYGLAIVLVSSLGVLLRLVTNKKKFE